MYGVLGGRNLKVANFTWRWESWGASQRRRHKNWISFPKDWTNWQSHLYERVSIKLRNELPNDREVLLLILYSKGPPIWQQNLPSVAPRSTIHSRESPRTDDWWKELWCTYRMKFYSALSMAWIHCNFLQHGWVWRVWIWVNLARRRGTYTK